MATEGRGTIGLSCSLKCRWIEQAVIYVSESNGQRGASIKRPTQRASSQSSSDKNVKVSFEFLPPETAAGERSLWRSIKRLEPLEPIDVGITNGGLGSTRERTHAMTLRILSETQLSVAPHLTCVSATRHEVDEIAYNYWKLGIRKVVAIRGESGGEAYRRYLGGYVDATSLVAGIRAIAPFEIVVAVHPEKHPESRSLQAEIDVLKAKIDAGATSAITQCFFDNEIFFRFLDRVRAAGITIPITPGILPIYNFEKAARFASRWEISIPDRVVQRVANLADDPDTRRVAAVANTTEQLRDLVDAGVRDFHFYTLNQSDIVFAICHMLGLRSKS
ncbi:MAG: methylenetetrahydrofolate reductase [Candidatus Pacebacteria bacterium]|nr:methylenetetrahydrofolate reductase [Candidatus Paceibacterota bacterium]